MRARWVLATAMLAPLVVQAGGVVATAAQGAPLDLQGMPLGIAALVVGWRIGQSLERIAGAIESAATK